MYFYLECSHLSFICSTIPVHLTIVWWGGSTCCEVDHGCGSCCDGIHLRMDLMLGLVHLVFTPGLRSLEKMNKDDHWWQKPTTNAQCSFRVHLDPIYRRFYLTASVPRGGSVSKSSREACAAWTACMLELMVPVRACCAEVCGHNKVLSLLYHTTYVYISRHFCGCVLWTCSQWSLRHLKYFANEST